MIEWRPGASVDALRARAAATACMRAFFAERDILEVQTPLLGVATVTDPDVEAITVPGYGFLQTSPEYFLKRLLAAGLPSCYQLAPAFRHDEQGRLHNPEFLMLEWYRLDFDADTLMQEVAALCDRVLGEAEYQTVTYLDLVGADFVGESPGAVLDQPRGDLDLKFAEACEALKPGRFFIVDYPAEQAALARLRPDDPRWAARFELVIDGVEIANGYWELQDVQEHERRFEEDLRIRQGRGLPVHAVDGAFMAALACGLPDCAGVALGVDRLVMLQQGATSLDDVLSFRR